MNKIIWVIVLIVLIVLGVKYFGGDDVAVPPVEDTPAAVGTVDMTDTIGTDVSAEVGAGINTEVKE